MRFHHAGFRRGDVDFPPQANAEADEEGRNEAIQTQVYHHERCIISRGEEMSEERPTYHGAILQCFTPERRVISTTNLMREVRVKLRHRMLVQDIQADCEELLARGMLAVTQCGPGKYWRLASHEKTDAK